MKKGILKKFAAGLAAVVLVFVFVVATRSSEFRVERETVVTAPPETVFAQVNDFHAWTSWSPYEKIDPSMVRTYEGPSSGNGAVYSWRGNDKVGEGRMTIEQSDAPARISIKLEFFKPWEATCTATFTFARAENGEGTKVTWTMDGHNNFVAKAAGLFMDMDKMRAAARTGPAGEPVLLLDQDRGRWDQLLIRRGLAALERAEALGGGRGPYALQGAIAACHARATIAADTDWPRIAALYGELVEVTGSPVVELNRAVAVAMADGPAAGLALLDRLAPLPAMQRYHLLPSARGDLLSKLGRHEEAAAEFERAASLTRNEREITLMLERAAKARRAALS